MTATESLFRQLIEDEDSATLALFRQLCRRSSTLRRWLWEDFVREKKVRSGFAQFIKNSAPLSNGAHWAAELNGEDRAWREERRRLRQQMPHAARPYGGLSRSEMEKLVRQYQAGTVDVGVFLLAHDWRKAAAKAKDSSVLVRSAVEFVDAIVNSGQVRLLKHLAKALRSLKDCPPKTQRQAAFGYLDWWKLHVLFYMLRHPRPSYRTRELRAHLATLGLEVGAKDIRRFCTRHGIRRDMRAGRPCQRRSAIK
ncbi:MAG: hypothetical protein KGJ37_03145 [Verrucomicrobiota bacterium]|nr:hypothetical protein [Verrucomicrobiota bacterium]